MTTETLTLTDFLLARIAEDEADARAGLVAEGSWRVLAECEAKRRIVELHSIREASPSCSQCGGYTATTDGQRGIVHHGYAIPWPCPTLRALALPYADHPDYREDWRP